jgi:hypothetical protein
MNNGNDEQFEKNILKWGAPLLVWFLLEMIIKMPQNKAYEFLNIYLCIYAFFAVLAFIDMIYKGFFKKRNTNKQKDNQAG